MYSKSFRDKLVLQIIKDFNSSLNIDLQIKKSLEKFINDKKSLLRLKRYHFPKGFEDVLLNFLRLNEEKLINISRLKKNFFTNLRVHEKIIFIIMEYLKILNNYKKSFRELFIYMLINARFISANRVLFRIADQTWFISGDKSLDFNYYTKRLILMKVYFLTFLFWLKNEDTKNLNKTKVFVEKIIKRVLTFGKIKSRLKGLL
ncbi:MAG: COQ9 family protein [Rickettsiales bacterium]|nr:COQ9 family protein [Rickettsiales bacterium]|tara:strand:+ start:164 stop:772 length:609 start_codon:yes stop_codon:yes gene_type:complete